MDFIATIILFCTTGLAAANDEERPVFKSVPTTVRVREHETVLLPCYVDNLGGSRVVWWKGDTVIAEGVQVIRRNMELHRNNTLEISDVDVTDSGTYTCQVLRPKPWGPINQQHVVEVLFPPVVNMTPEGDLEVEIKQEVSITCEIDGSPKPTLTWYFDDEEIKVLNPSNTLTFIADKGSMSGKYSCVAANSLGDTSTASLNLKVIYPPIVSIERVWAHSSPDVKSEVTCDIEGNPQPEVEWYKDNILVKYSPRVYKSKKGRRHSLIITRTTGFDFGYYKCIASNKLGTAQQVIELSGLPHIPTFKKVHQEKLPDRFILVWEVDSNSPILHYSLVFREYKKYELPFNWTKIIVPAQTSTGPIHTQTYTLAGLKPATAYEASVMARNQFGWSRPSSIFRFATLGKELDSIIALEDNESNTVTQDFQEPTVKLTVNSGERKSAGVLLLALIYLIVHSC